MKRNSTLLLVLAAIFFAGCDLEKEVEIKLPPFESKLIVECYMRKDNLVQVGISETQDYFAAAKFPFVDSATVTLSWGNERRTLSNFPQFDLDDVKYYNYLLPQSISIEKGVTYTLEVTDKKGRTAVAATQWLDPVPIDSTDRLIQQRDTLYNLLAYFTDPPERNYYRFRARLLSDSMGNDPVVTDYFSDDNIVNGKSTVLGTGYYFKAGDTVELSLYHINKEYYDFLSTVIAAADANGNPFAQPAIIKSNVTGGTGIFTVLPFDRRIIVVK